MKPETRNSKLIPNSLESVRAIRPFWFRRGRVGCLLVHGLTSTPYTLRAMGQWLARRGVTVLAPLLAGHGTTWRALERTTWRDWYASAEAGYDRLRRRCRCVYAAGISMGGVLVLHLAARRPDLRGVIAMAPALYLSDWRLPFLSLLKHVVRTTAPIGGDLRDPHASSEYHYDRLPTWSLHQLIKLQAVLNGELPRVRCPVLLMQGVHDRVVPPGNARAVYRRIGSRRKQLVTLHRSAHVITLDQERERVFTLALKFIRRNGLLPVKK